MSSPTLLSSIDDAYQLAFRGINRLSFLSEALDSLSRSMEDDQLAGLSAIIEDAHREASEGVSALRELADKAAISTTEEGN